MHLSVNIQLTDLWFIQHCSPELEKVLIATHTHANNPCSNFTETGRCFKLTQKSLKQGEQIVITYLGYKNGPEHGHYLLRTLPKMVIYLG